MFNQIVNSLPPYPMEELNRIKASLKDKGTPIFDFGTGDPKIPTWPPLKDALTNAVPEISQYPSIRGHKELTAAIWSYLERRFKLNKTAGLDVIPTNGSKEGVFHTALCAVGRKGKKRIIYPNPGYPVYRSGTLFAQGIPTPVELKPDNGFLLCPWELPEDVQNETAAIWVNYPHNPTGAVATKEYYLKLIDWAQNKDVLILSDECYVDVYREDQEQPLSLSSFGSERVLSFMSLSKRSGLTGYRSGFILGPKSLIDPLARARANFGAGTPIFVQKAATSAWLDDDHVKERRKVFAARMDKMIPALQILNLLAHKPQATFYLWCNIPKSFGTKDVDFCLGLAEKGVVTTPSSWLSEGVVGSFRLSMVPDVSELDEAIEIIAGFIRNG